MLQSLMPLLACPLLQRDLEPPLVADALGKMYNKDALIEFLIAPPPSAENPVSSRPFGADGLLAAGHLRSLKDVQTLKLTPSTSISTMTSREEDDNHGGATNAAKGGQAEYARARFECPITMRGMNGSVKFVYVRGCGCVASEVGLKEVASGTTKKQLQSNVEASATDDRATCPICASNLRGKELEMVTLNPVGEEKERMARAWAEKVAKEEREKAERKAAKKNGSNGSSKKRKEQPSDGPLASGEAGTMAASAGAPASAVKKSKVDVHAAAPAPSINRKMPENMPDAKKPVSKAILSLYGPKDRKDKLSPFFSSGYSRI